MKFVDNSKKVIAAKDDAINRALEMIGLQMEGYAKEALTESGAVDTGRLRGSITYTTKESHSTGQSPAEPADYTPRGSVEEGKVVVGTNVEYAPYIEFGTVKMAARPYLKRALDHPDEYKKIVKSQLEG